MNKREAAPKRAFTDGHKIEYNASRINSLIAPLTIKFSDIGEDPDALLENNKVWARAHTKLNPDFFIDQAKGQQPKIVWFGCSDSRVPAETVVQLGPGEIFVHRNIANQFNHADLNCLSVLQYAVEHLKVEHIIVCGHYGCGGVIASMSNEQHGLVDHWLRNIKDIYHEHKETFDNTDKDHSDLLVELNVKQQVYHISATNIVQNAWALGRKLEIHGWVYDLSTGLLKNLDVDVKNAESLCDKIYICR